MLIRHDFKASGRLLGVFLLVFSIALCSALIGCSSGGSSSNAASSSASGSVSATSAQASSSAQSSAESSSAGASSDAAASISTASTTEKPANGEYKVAVDTDSSMFHINEADEGTGVLTVTDEGMSVHIRLASKKITVLYSGTAEEAKADEAGWIQPTTDTVTYSDGKTEEVYGFDVPVPVLDEPFEVAILGSKGNWYSHKVTVYSPVV